MKTNVGAPSHVSYAKIVEFIQATPYNEGIHLVSSFYYLSNHRSNWLLFWCWCYVRTDGFRNPCWYKNWDAGKLGQKYETSRDGILDALSEFLVFADTSLMQEEEAVLKLYSEALKFCEGIVYHPPVEPPKPPQPPPPPQPPKPDPVPEPEPKPSKPPSTVDWKKVLKIAVPILTTLLGAAGIFLPLPGWVKVILETILKAIGS